MVDHLTRWVDLHLMPTFIRNSLSHSFVHSFIHYCIFQRPATITNLSRMSRHTAAQVVKPMTLHPKTIFSKLHLNILELVAFYTCKLNLKRFYIFVTLFNSITLICIRDIIELWQ